ncbi:MAG: hemerythrin [Parcubacteria group bacterium]|nr:hemerythrin [Parcubacteria group bacterium]
MENDPISIIKEDHKTVEALFDEYEGLGDSADVSKKKVVDQIIEELTIHAEMEEELCYPRFKKAFNKEDDKMVDEAYVEHEGVKDLLEELKSLDARTPEFDARMQVLMEQVKHHVKEEEGELLPTVEKEIPEEELEAMGTEMMAFKADRSAA